MLGKPDPYIEDHSIKPLRFEQTNTVYMTGRGLSQLNRVPAWTGNSILCDELIKKYPAFYHMEIISESGCVVLLYNITHCYQGKKI